MRCLVYLLLLLVVSLSSCKRRPSGLEQPTTEETPQGSGSSGTGNPLVITEDHCALVPCEPHIQPSPNFPLPEATQDPNNTTNQGDTGGNTPLVVDTPELSDSKGLDSVMLKAECMNCLHPLGNKEVELSCKVKGCADGFNFVISTNRPQRSYRRALCGSSSKTVSDLSGLTLFCEFRKRARFWFDYKKNTEVSLSKAMVEAQHLCVVTADSFAPSGGDDMLAENLRPEPKIERSNCNHSSMWRKQHKLALSFSW